MDKYLMTVRLDGPATIGAAAKALGVKKSLIDVIYGVVEVDPDANLFAVQVEQSANLAQTNAQSGSDGNYQGPFSNPRITPFGPVSPMSSNLP